ncbi:MAG: putative heme transporter [Acidimicrobiaceae bacterium]
MRARVWLTVAAFVSFVFVWPTLRDVYRELGQVLHLHPGWLLAIVGCEVAGFVSVWELQRIVLRDGRWRPIATAQLAANAASHVVPAGGAAGLAVQVRMLTAAGIDLTTAVSGLTATSVLGTAGLFVLPLAAVPTVLTGNRLDHRLEVAVWIGVAAFVVVAAVGTALLVADRPVLALARFLQRVRNVSRRRHLPRTDVPTRVLAERDLIRESLARHKLLAAFTSVSRTGFDYVALILCLGAVGAGADPAVALVAFAASEVAGMVPFTPGGVGFVEAGLTSTLILAGVHRHDAFLAVATYRVGSLGLPLVAGLVALALFGREAEPDKVPVS